MVTLTFLDAADSYNEEDDEFLEILEDAIASQNYKLPEDNRAEYLYPDEQSKSDANQVENNYQNYQWYQVYEPGLPNEEKAPILNSPDVEKELLSFARHYIPQRHLGQWLPTPPPMAIPQNAKIQPLKAFDEQDSREALYDMMHQAEDWFPLDKVTDE